MSKKQKPYWTEKQISDLKKYMESDEGIKNMNEAIKKGEIKGEKIRKSMEFTWEEWSKIKDEPFNI